MAGPSGATARLALPYPTPDDTVDVPRDVKALAEKVDPLAILPVGAVLMWAVAAAPVGFLLMDGQLVSAATYPKLAALLGQAAGQVTIPDWRTKMPLGAGTGYALGAQGGEATHLLTAGESGMPSHGHADSLAVAAAGSHNHYTSANARNVPQTTAGWNEVGFGSGGFRGPGTSGSADITDALLTSTAAAHAHSLTGGVTAAAAVNAAAAHNNLPPYVVVNFIICAG